MNQQEQIQKLEESNKELQRQIELQAKQIEALKAASVQNDDERFAPYKEAGWAIIKRLDDPCHSIWGAYNNPSRQDYYAYQTREQAEWENKATQVRRKLQKICAVLGPATDLTSSFSVIIRRTEEFVVPYYPVRFARYADAQKAERILGYDLQYLDWNNSPEARDAREGRV